jgi:hypothetical protein
MDVLNQRQWLEKYKLCSKFFFDFFRFFSIFFEKLIIVFRIFRCHAHDDGVYGIDMNSKIVVSGGDDGLVKVFKRLLQFNTLN